MQIQVSNPQLALGITEAAAVAGGEFHSFALLKSGKVKAWGENNDGQLGNGTTTTEKEPVEVKALTSIRQQGERPSGFG